jgi:hypothetical protein
MSEPGGNQVNRIESDQIRIKVYSQEGKLVMDKLYPEETIKMILDVSHLPSGSYFTTIEQGNHIENQSFIIQK